MSMSKYNFTNNSTHPRDPPGWPDEAPWTILKMSLLICEQRAGVACVLIYICGCLDIFYALQKYLSGPV